MQENNNYNPYRFTTGKLVIGIISIVLSFVITFQSCAAGLANTLEANGSSSGSMGIFLAFCWLVGGIVGIAARKTKGGSITAGAFYIVGALAGFGNAGYFADLKIWAVISLIFAVIFILSVILKKKEV